MDRFLEIMETVFKWEGNYVEHSVETGGAKNMGITEAVLAKWKGVPAVTKQEIRDLTKDEALEIYRKLFFDVIMGGSLPKPIDLIMMDGAANHGTKTMIELLQGALGLGISGELTKSNLDALKKAISKPEGLLDLVGKLAAAQRARVLGRPLLALFGRSWVNRLSDVMQIAVNPLGWGWTFARGLISVLSSSGLNPDPVSAVVRPSIEDEELQAAMTTWGDYTGEIDGIFGSASLAAADRALERNSGLISGDWRRWSTSRKKLAIGQLICRDLDIDIGRIDGLFGPLTEAAFDKFNRMRLGQPDDNWRDELERELAVLPSEPGGPDSPWPKESDLKNFYGKECTPGDRSGSCGKGDIKLKRLSLPFEMKIAWDLDTKIDGFSINEKVHDSAARVFEKIHGHYGDDGVEEIGVNLFGGCYNCRKIRGGSRCSTHAWGIAIDFDPERNQLKWDHKLARLAKPDAVKFWEFWETDGWVSLGRARDFDWMHVQAARL